MNKGDFNGDGAIATSQYDVKTDGTSAFGEDERDDKHDSQENFQ